MIMLAHNCHKLFNLGIPDEFALFQVKEMFELLTGHEGVAEMRFSIICVLLKNGC